MARPLRIQYPDALYHITMRGNAKQNIFLSDKDRTGFLKILGSVVETFNWICHAYCLMGNHYHVLVETPDGNLSDGMRQVNGMYTQIFNRVHGRTGHLFEGRFKSFLIEKEVYLLEVARYIVLNPVRAKFCSRPQDWTWSSYRATRGLGPKLEFLTISHILRFFGRKKESAQKKYEQFVLDGLDGISPFEHVQDGVLGSQRFVHSIRELVDDPEALNEIPRSNRFVGRPALDDLFHDDAEVVLEERNKAILLARFRAGYSVREIADYLGLHYTTVSRIIHRKDVVLQVKT